MSIRTLARPLSVAFALSMWPPLLAIESAHAQEIPKLPAELVQSAQQAAQKIAGGKKLGGVVTFLGNTGGYQGNMLRAVMKPFEDATGATVDYTASPDLQAILQTRVQAGNPPDIVNATRAAEATRYAAQGNAVDVGAIIGVDRLREMYDANLLKNVEHNGKIYGLWSTIDNFMIWHNANTYDGPKQPKSWAELMTWVQKEADAGKTPWCMADERGPASGATSTSWMLAYFLKKNGAEKMQALASGALSWTSPEVRDAYTAFGNIASNQKMVAGGSAAVLSTSVTRWGAGLFTSPQRCSILMGPIWAGSALLNVYPNIKPITDLNFFAIPPVDPISTNQEIFAGNVLIAFSTRPEVAAFLQYWSSVEAQSLLASVGFWNVANQKVPLTAYGNPLLRQAAEVFMNRDHQLIGTPAQLASPAVNEALWKGMVQFIRNPSSLDQVLASIQAASK